MERIFIKKQFLSFCALFLFSSITSSYEVVEVCATYKNSGKKYKVEANVFKGDELNKRTKTYDYNYFGWYVIIFWGDDQATVIELTSAIGGLGVLGNDGVDQRGYPWHVTRSTLLCY